MFPSKSKSTAAGGKGVEFCPPVAGLSSADPPPPLFLHQTVNGGVPSLSGCRAHSPPKTSRRQIRQGKSGKIRTLASSRALVSLGQVSLAKVQRVPPPFWPKKGVSRPRAFSFFFLSIRKLFLQEEHLRKSFPHCLLRVKPIEEKKSQTEETTLGGGSLGSCVDEERSQLRELM